jgi:tetratricopeptide (TPR) repeat protein
VRNSIRPVALALAVLSLSGCAAGRGGSLAGRFVRPGEPQVDFGGPPVASGDSLQGYIKQVRHVSAAAMPRSSTFGTTIESSNQRLAAALLIESVLLTADSHVGVGEEYRRLGVLDSAHARFNRALESAPRLAAAHEGLARVWRDWGFPDLGLGAAYRAAYYDPRSASAQNTLGTIFDAMGRSGDARQAYERALSLDPTAAWALNNLCYAEFKLGNLAKAASHCEQALEIEPGLTAAHNNLALTFAAAGDFERARQEFLAAGDAATANYNLGIVHLAERDYVSAAGAFEQAITARPSFTAAKAQAHAARMRALTGSN